MSPFPFPTDKCLVPRNRARSQRQCAVIIISQEAVERLSRACLRLPGEEVVPTSGHGKLTETFSRNLVGCSYVYPLDVPLARVLNLRVDAEQIVVVVTNDAYVVDPAAVPAIRVVK